ncbi:hypothetical protein KBZ20_14270 [Vulcanococcus limneticus Candia 3F8]|uniref:hypothetical protein n=1 Tax=Vulcanococcus limneticus TaxID=2170428 RepID=UPI0012FF6FEB|nr:hypothetical protein [Vulcanococcus limneticus]MCP9894937.1 hypothetical protein [Vulcanococcus limneticus Candia 3F8]MCP9898935.1 hypothetical protein [Vulcanococcus limneticus Candia 3B3]
MRSLHEPHPDSTATAAVGIQAWAESLPAGDDDLLDPDAGVTVRWRTVQGWQETEL